MNFTSQSASPASNTSTTSKTKKSKKKGFFHDQKLIGWKRNALKCSNPSSSTNTPRFTAPTPIQVFRVSPPTLGSENTSVFEFDNAACHQRLLLHRGVRSPDENCDWGVFSHNASLRRGKSLVETQATEVVIFSIDAETNLWEQEARNITVE